VAGADEPSLAVLRRDRVLLWLWVPGGVLAIALLMQGWLRLFGEPPRALVNALCVAWIVTMLLMIWRHSSRRCPDCGYRYLRAFPWMSLKKVRCPACGYELK
jgi:DNA-directed RNA polymerase subunit RPC12/RpoP